MMTFFQRRFWASSVARTIRSSSTRDGTKVRPQDQQQEGKDDCIKKDCNQAGCNEALDLENVAVDDTGKEDPTLSGGCKVFDGVPANSRMSASLSLFFSASRCSNETDATGADRELAAVQRRINAEEKPKIKWMGCPHTRSETDGHSDLKFFLDRLSHSSEDLTAGLYETLRRWYSQVLFQLHVERQPNLLTALLLLSVSFGHPQEPDD